MVESRYEKYIIRKAAVITENGQEVVPDRILGGRADTGPIVMCSPNLMKGTDQLFEYGLISGDITTGSGPGDQLRSKNNRDVNIFCFWGTNPDDPNDLGAEAEFLLGEGVEAEKITINTPSAVYVPAGVARFPLSWKNVKRPCMFAVLGRINEATKKEIKKSESSEAMSHIPVISDPDWAEEFMKEAKYTAESRYEKYVIRKPYRIAGATRGDTGPIILCAPGFVEGVDQFFEYAIISGEFVAGSGPNENLRTRSNISTIFYFLGTNPEDPSDLGAEVEFWLGDGEETEKMVINSPSALYVPPEVPRFPIRWKNLKRPCIFGVITRMHIAGGIFKPPENAHVPVIWQPD
jgi:hypothetical protein